MADVYAIASDYRRRVVRGEAAARARVRARYAAVAARAAQMLESDVARDRGRAVLAMIATDGAEAAQAAASAIARAQQQAQLLGIAASGAAIGTDFRRPPLEALDLLIGALADGTPVGDALARRMALRMGDLTDLLAAGLAAGDSPLVIGKRLSESLAVGAREAETIARTEILRSYRSASLESYRANADVVKGWIWTSSQDATTCAACWAMDGVLHDVGEEFASHPNCRCTPRPALGGDDAVRPEGDAAFAALDAATQASILGQARYELWRGGVPLARMATVVQDDRWGPVLSVTPLSALV